VSVSKHTAYNLAGALIPLALSFATVPLYLHLVGPDRYGVLAIAWLLLGYFGLFDLGLGRATSFRIASLKDPDGAVHADVFKTAVGINMGIGAVGGVILWLAGWWFFGSIFKVGPDLRAETLQALPWLAASVPVATMTGVLSGALQGREKFLETNTVSVISTVLFQILPLGVAWFYGPHLAGLLAAAVLARVVAIIVMWFSCHKEFTRGHSPRWRKDEARELLAFGGWVTLNSFLWPLLIMTDRFLIGGLLNSRAVAVYTIPFQLAQRASVVPTAVANALFPRLASSAEEARNATFDKSVRTAWSTDIYRSFCV
jgi:O-antigen/teichoic acid export membrane protein